MQAKYQHLNEENMEQYGQHWIPAIPLPFYESRGLFRHTVYQCGCGARFSNEHAYREHYRTEQMVEMNGGLSHQRHMQHAKATFWRRLAFVLQHGSATDKKEALAIGTPEMKNYEEICLLNDALETVWRPVYDEKMQSKAGTIGRVRESGVVEDETPEEAAKTMNKPFEYTNSQGVTYYLNMKRVSLRAGRMVPIYFFSRDIRPDTAVSKLPSHFTVQENPRNGFLAVKRKTEEPSGKKISL